MFIKILKQELRIGVIFYGLNWMPNLLESVVKNLTKKEKNYQEIQIMKVMLSLINYQKESSNSKNPFH